MSAIFDENTQYTDEVTQTLATGANIYVGEPGLDPKTNEKDVFNNRTFTPPALAQPIITGADGRSPQKLWVSGKYSLTIDNSANVQKYQSLDNGFEEAVGNIQTTNSLGVNDITATGVPVQTAYTDNKTYIVTAPADNTGAMTINLDAIGVIPIKKVHDQAIASGDVKQDMKLVLVYNSTDNWMELQSGVLSTTLDSLLVNGNATFSKGADIASATALVIGSDGNYFDVTGTAAVITGATQANPCVITAVAHGFATADSVTIEDVVGMVELNGNTYTITVLTDDTFELDSTDSSAFTAYTSGGVATLNITSIGTVAVGTVIKLHFDGVVNLRHHATDLVLPDGVDIVTTAGDEMEIIEYAIGDWRVLSYLGLNFGSLRFPVTQVQSSNPNTLDDYEEGTFTVGMSALAGTITLSASANTMSYTKIGRKVTVGGRITVTAVSTPSSSVSITGLPFTCANLSETAGNFSGVCWAENLVGGGSDDRLLWASIGEGTTQIGLRETANAFDGTDVVSGSSFTATITYFTD